MKELEVEHAAKIDEYYTQAHLFYYIFWHWRTFGLHYGLWDKTTKNRHQAIINENAYLAKLAQVSQKDKVLDAGCGVGGSSVWIAKNIGAQVVGLNLNFKQLESAKIVASHPKYNFNVPDKVDWVRGTYQKEPFQDNSFDVIWSLESIEHASSVNQFLAESFRILKPNGRIVIAATLSGDTKPNIEQQAQLEVGVRTSGAFKDSKSANEIRDLMQEVGYIQIQIEDRTQDVLRSARDITNMCRWGYPIAKFLGKIGAVSPIIAMNNQWGLYQEKLFRDGVTSYNVIVGRKPQLNQDSVGI